MRIPSRVRSTTALLLLGLSCSRASAQQNDHWFFGHSAGIDFSSGAAVPATSGLDALEGTAAMSDASGALLFYTEGTTLWDSNGNVMPNGNGLLGGASSTQAALIVPMPGTCSKFYVFTSQDHLQTGDIRYSVVDMCLNGGLGDVDPLQKNILVAPSCGERLTAVPHTNGTDVWILTHGLGNADFLAFRLTATGLQPAPVTSTVGAVHAVTCTIGPLKASHDGRHLVCEATFCNTCELFDFDAATGAVSNAVDLVALLNLPGAYYGAEFSPNDRLLYLCTTFSTCTVRQLDLTTLQLTDLVSLPGNYLLGALQLGSDGRIYVARQNEAFLDVITDPDVSGTGCNYVPAGFTLLGGSTSDIGLPNMVPSTVLGPQLGQLRVDLGRDTSYCNAAPFVLSAPGGCTPTYQWQDGTAGTTTTVNGPGTYWVRMVDACGSDTDSLVVFPPGVIPIDLGQDATLCAGSTVVLDAMPGANTVLWQDGSTDPTLDVTQPGLYWAQVSDACGSSRDSVVVTGLPTITTALGPDVTLCPGDSLVVSAPAGTITALWSDGSTLLTRSLRSSGTYWLRAEGPCNTSSDTLVVTLVDQDRLNAPMPNVFSPNGDGVNDVFHVPDLFRVVSLTIFDRWGQTIYTTDLPADGWNGRTGNAGEPVPEGTYFYVVVRHNDCTDEISTDHGAVTLLR